MNLNPLLLRTEAPPIPAAKAWAAAYDGARGPLIDLSQAVPGYPPHPELLQRLGEAAASPQAASYGDIVGDAGLRRVYAEQVSTHYGAAVHPKNIAITAGCNQAFVVALLALARAGDAVLLPTPWYFNHKMALDMLGIEAIALPCRAENAFVPDVEEARRLLNGRVRAMVLVTPNNPTGAIYPPRVIASFYALAAERGVPLVIDETYRDFNTAAAPPHDCLADADWAGTLIQLYSFSKSYCIPGHRVGAMAAAENVIAEIAKILDTLQICAPRAPQQVLPWAMMALAGWCADNRAEILMRTVAFKHAMAVAEGWKIGSIGAYFAYVAHPHAGDNDAEVCARLARECGVLMLPGSYFGPGQTGFLRAAFANVGATEIAQIPGRLARDGAAAGVSSHARLEAAR